jgi:predicted RNase H-like HicB family nuclease
MTALSRRRAARSGRLGPDAWACSCHCCGAGRVARYSSASVSLFPSTSAPSRIVAIREAMVARQVDHQRVTVEKARYHADVERDGRFWFAKVRELPGCFTQAERLEDMEAAQVRDAIALYLEVPEDRFTLRMSPEALTQAPTGTMCSTPREGLGDAPRRGPSPVSPRLAPAPRLTYGGLPGNRSATGRQTERSRGPPASPPATARLDFASIRCAHVAHRQAEPSRCAPRGRAG